MLTVGPCHAGYSSMLKGALVLYYFFALGQPLWAQDDVTAAAITPQDCSLDCIRQVNRLSNLLCIYTSSALGLCFVLTYKQARLLL